MTLHIFSAVVPNFTDQFGTLYVINCSLLRHLWILWGTMFWTCMFVQCSTSQNL